MVLGESDGVSGEGLVGGFVNRAVEAFRIAETLGQKRTVVVLGEPLGGKLA